MKRRFLMVLAAAALAAGTVLPVSAQTRTLKASIPFTFSTGQEEMPAGEYSIDVDLQYNRMVLRSSDGRSSAFLVPSLRAHTEQFLDKGSLVFARYGEDYFLRKLNMAGPSLNFEWAPSKVEKRLAGKTPVRVAMIRIALP